MNRPPYLSHPTLESERVTLREITRADIDQIVDISFYDAIPAATAQEAWQMLQRIDGDYRAGDTFHWGIIDKYSGCIAGTCSYCRGFANESGELGFVLKTGFRGRGLMTSALQLAIEFGFATVQLRRITARTTPDNLKTIALLGRLGFKRVADFAGGDIIEFELFSSK